MRLDSGAMVSLLPLTPPTNVRPQAISTEVPLTSKCDSALLTNDSAEIPPLDPDESESLERSSTPGRAGRTGIGAAA
jgi:hypothetical protein